MLVQPLPIYDEPISAKGAMALPIRFRQIAFGTISAAAVVLALAGSPPANSNHAAVAPATAPSTGGVCPTSGPAVCHFDHAASTLTLDYLATWKPKSDKDYDLLLIPSEGPSDRSISLDIPDLPPHFPGMIRLGLIENGYINDLKPKHAGLKVDRSEVHAAPGGASARLVEISWSAGGKEYRRVGLLMMRKEVVYILSCEADAGNIAAVRADFDRVAGSMRWKK